MSLPALTAIVIAGAYVVGSIPFGLLLARRRGVDIRVHGSGNIGATNVARTVGATLGVLVLVLDALKGAAPLLAANALRLPERVSPYVTTVVGMAAIVGHCAPVWLRFRGGKGVATSLGVFIVAGPQAAALAVAVFALIYAVVRIVAIASLGAALTVPLSLWLLGAEPAVVLLGVLAYLVIVLKHRDNLRRLLSRR